jgi:hypothetical protein
VRRDAVVVGGAWDDHDGTGRRRSLGLEARVVYRSGGARMTSGVSRHSLPVPFWIRVVRDCY